MTLLTICNAVLDQVGIDELSTIVNNPDRSARRLLALANRGGKRLAKQNWTVLQNEHSFTTEADQPNYVLPGDYETLQYDTAWDRTNYWNMRGSLTPSEWQVRKSAIIATTAVRKTFRIKPQFLFNTFYVDPTPTAVETLVFEYRSNAWCKSVAIAGQTEWLADTDTGILSEELLELDLLWRYRGALGLSYLDERKEAEDAIKQALAQDGGMRVLHGPEPEVIGAVNIPEAGFG